MRPLASVVGVSSEEVDEELEFDKRSAGKLGKEGGVMVLGGLLLLLLVGFGVCVGKYVVGFDGGKEGIVMFSVDGGVMLRML